jgi:RecA-family ATPase|tara:strand:+ start:6303 stop:7040 length:738 start_codon:yes stop_codon:yes gene_type:complete
MPFRTLQELFLVKYPPVKEFIGMSILRQQNRLCVFGGPKMFKSLMAAQIGLCIASGVPWLGFKTVKAKVTILQAELAERDFRDRLIPMSQNVALPPNSLFVETDTGFKLDIPGNLTRLETHLKKEQPDVLILDPWYKMLSVEDNKSYDKSKDIMDKLGRDYGVAIIMIHHDTVPERNSQTGQLETKFHPRGSRTVEGWFDSIIQIDGDIATDERMLRFEMRHPTTLLRPVPVKLDRSKVWMEYNP